MCARIQIRWQCPESQSDLYEHQLGLICNLNPGNKIKRRVVFECDSFEVCSVMVARLKSPCRHRSGRLQAHASRGIYESSRMTTSILWFPIWSSPFSSVDLTLARARILIWTLEKGLLVEESVTASECHWQCAVSGKGGRAICLR